MPRESLRRSVAYTDCDGNGNSGCKRYAYRDGDGDGNSSSNSNSNTDAYSYCASKGYSDAETAADSPPAPVGRNLNR